jgi:hypothetical protein
MALHERSVGVTSEWYTPSYIFAALGSAFDTDAASPGQQATPWIPAEVFITHNSLTVPWNGFVWLNPPFGGRNGLVPWLEKFFRHGNGICLAPDRTSAPWWQKFVPRAELVLFVSPKIRFIGADGRPGPSPAQGTCLLAIGERGREAVDRAAERGLGVLMRPASEYRPTASINRIHKMRAP